MFLDKKNQYYKDDSSLNLETRQANSKVYMKKAS